MRKYMSGMIKTRDVYVDFSFFFLFVVIIVILVGNASSCHVS